MFGFEKTDGQIAQLLCDVATLLDELAEAEADFDGPVTPPAGDGVADRLAELSCYLSRQFTLDEMEWSAPLQDAHLRLHGDHEALLQQLEHVFELTGSPLRPASTWLDIDSSFRRFAARLTDCERSKHELRQMPTAGDKASKAVSSQHSVAEMVS